MPLVLRIGQKTPDFVLPDTENRLRSLGEFLGGAPVMVAFFPFAFSGMCDKEMCAFRDGLVPSQSVHLRVIGVSVDSVFTLKVFLQTYNLPFPLLSDFNKKVTKLYGVLQDQWVALGYRGVARRSVFIVDGMRVLRYKWIADVPTDEPPYAEIAKALRKLAG